MDEVLGWQYGSRGLVISGPTGVGKSRLMWLLLRRLLDEENRTALFLNAVRFRTGVQAAARDGTSEEFVRRLVRAEVLYWDDLGQMHLTGAASEMLLHLLEERICAGRPILATTQYSGKGMDAQFERPEMGQAIRRRLNEFCGVVIVREAGEHYGVSLLQQTARR
jgi:DNA replication protein DnaC